MPPGPPPPTISGLMAMVSDHVAEDRAAFDAMTRAFNQVAETQQKQLAILTDQNRVLADQNVRLDKILGQAEASGEERGRRKETEAARERWERRWRYVIIPLAVAASHFATKWLHL